MDNRILYLLKQGHNFAISGAGGVGKSFQINHIIKWCRDNEIKCSVTASTGTAALLINGSTLHNWCGISPDMIKRFKDGNYIYYPKKERPSYKRVKNTRVLIIDEVSMLGKDTFDFVDVVCKSIKKNSLPFGGIQIILSFDMLQLPPVSEEFVFKSDSWDKLNLKYIYLSKVYRTSDEKFIEILQRAREGKLTKNDVVVLKNRINSRNDEFEELGIEPTVLYSHKADVTSLNYDKLSEISAPCINYQPRDYAFVNKKLFYKNGTFSKQATADLQDEVKRIESYMDTSIPTECLIKPGAQVMLTVNMAVSEGLVNGSRGVVIACDSTGVDVIFNNKNNNQNKQIKITYVERTYEDNNIMFLREYMPLKLAWALTLHSVQGQSLDYAIINLGKNIFSPGQAYVGLSRLRSLEGLVLTEFEPRKVFASTEALEFEKHIKKVSVVDSPDDDFDNTIDEHDTESL